MNRCLNESAKLFGIPMPFMVLLLTSGVVSLCAMGSFQIPIACFIIFVIARAVYWYDPLFCLLLGSYLRMPDVYDAEGKINGSKAFSNDLLWGPIVGMYDAGVIIGKDSGKKSMQITIKLEGLDFISTPLPVRQRCHETINEGLKVLAGYNITVYWDRKRTKCIPDNRIIDSNARGLSDSLMRMCDERENLFNNVNVFKNEYFLTLTFAPEPTDRKAYKFSRFFIQSVKEEKKDAHESDVNKFKKIIDKFKNVVSETLELKALNRQQTAKYLHSCISNKRFQPENKVSDDTMNWSMTLPDQPLYKGLSTILDKGYIKTIGIKSFPVDLNPEMRNIIGRLPFEFGCCVRVDLLKQKKALKLVKDKKITWGNSSINFGAVFASLFTGGHQDATEKFESDMADDCQNILDDLKESKYALSKVTYTFTIIDEDEDKAIEKAELLKKVLENNGLNVCTEGLNSMQAFLSSIPGTVHVNPRQFNFSTENITKCILPFSSPWSGSENQDCLFTAKGQD